MSDYKNSAIRNANLIDDEGLKVFWGKTKQYIDENEKVTAVALTDLSKKVENNIPMVSVTYAELVTLRNNGELVSGQQYRITDYETTTSQSGTISAGHPFDVIVTALDESTLSENASAVKRENDTYFETENLEAWQLKYCLDNDTEKFAWADDGSNLHKAEFVAMFWDDPVNGTNYDSHIKNDKIYDWETLYDPETEMDNIVIYKSDANIYKAEGSADYYDQYFYRGIVEVDGEEYDSWKKFDVDEDDWVTNDEGQCQYALTERMVFDGEVIWPELELKPGKGVIYNMIDEYGNECPYDFKNIKFYNDGLGTDVYTFTWIDEDYNVMDTSVFGNNGTLTFYGELNGVYGNVIKPYMEKIYDENDEYIGTKQLLNKITFISDYMYDQMGNEGFHGCYNNIFDYNCRNNSFSNACNDNSFGRECYNNNFDNSCLNNSFGDACSRNSFIESCYDNRFGQSCSNNSFDGNCQNNSFSNDCANNSFGGGCAFNSFGNECRFNEFDGICSYNSFGNGCNKNKFGYSCSNNSFGNNCHYNSFSNNCRGNSFANECRDNSFRYSCSNNSFGNYCCYNSFRLSASTTGTLIDYCSYNHFDDGCSYNVIWNDVQPTLSNKLQNINVSRGVSGTYSAYNFINIVDKNAAYEIKVAKNSSGVIKVYCEADLIN